MEDDDVPHFPGEKRRNFADEASKETDASLLRALSNLERSLLGAPPRHRQVILAQLSCYRRELKRRGIQWPSG